MFLLELVKKDLTRSERSAPLRHEVTSHWECADWQGVQAQSREQTKVHEYYLCKVSSTEQKTAVGLLQANQHVRISEYQVKYLVQSLSTLFIKSPRSWNIRLCFGLISCQVSAERGFTTILQ